LTNPFAEKLNYCDKREKCFDDKDAVCKFSKFYWKDELSLLDDEWW
jgi:hypothetical protein